ncbi:cytokine receptor-like [Anticarsia gemmatalis]|uniref:cytokine receptor-like n=1 Tax=Anticarsia gemmatalis TaxID=129554 RepID=UPI003F768E74
MEAGRGSVSGTWTAWWWCVALAWLAGAPRVSSSCHGVNISVSVAPAGIIFVPHGEPLEIYCVNEISTADDLQMYLGAVPIESGEIVNSTTKRFYLENLKKGAYTFYCSNQSTKKKCTSRVLVDSPPSNISDFGCLSQNLESMNCSWTSPETYSTPQYSLSLSVTNTACVPRRNGKIYSCYWDSHSAPRYRQMEDDFYFVLEACNHFGCIQQNFTINHASIVQPAPPELLRAVSTGAHSVDLTWHLSHNLVDLLPGGVTHKIQYQILNYNDASPGCFHTVDASFLPTNNRTYRFTLYLPYAHTSYMVRIWLKSRNSADDKLWSDFQQVQFSTDSEKPQRPPATVAGAFEQALFDGNRIVYVYWEPLEETERAGDNFTYTVIVPFHSQASLTLEPTNNNNYVVLKNAPSGAIDVSILSTNAMGSSVNSSHFYVPAIQDSVAITVNSFTQFDEGKGKYQLSWMPRESVDNYTLLWCERVVTRVCTGRIFSTVLQANTNTHQVELSVNKPYQFAISANKGAKSSGMTWPSCDVSRETIPLYSPSIKLDYEQPGPTSVKITWSSACLIPDVIKGYEVRCCRGASAGAACEAGEAGGVRTWRVEGARAAHLLATELSPSTTYLCTLALNTTYGLKPIAHAFTRLTTASI